MTIVLSPETERLIHERMKVGGFSTADELVRVAQETFEIIDVDAHAIEQETQSAIERAEAQSARGEGSPVNEAFAKLRKKYLGE